MYCSPRDKNSSSETWGNEERKNTKPVTNKRIGTIAKKKSPKVTMKLAIIKAIDANPLSIIMIMLGTRFGFLWVFKYCSFPRAISSSLVKVRLPIV